MPKGHQFPDILGRRHTFDYFNDFDEEIDANQLVVTATDSGTGVVGDGLCGILPLIPSDGTVADNDETYVETPNQFVAFADNQPFHAIFRFQFTEANVDDVNVAVGLATGVAANTLQDNGGGIDPALTSVAAIYKVDGSNFWKCTAGGSAATQAANVKTSTRYASPGIAGITGEWQYAEIIYTPDTTTTGHVNFRVNGEDLCDSTGVRISISVTITGSTAMALFAGIKNGAATNVETLNLDFWGIQIRRAGAIA